MQNIELLGDKNLSVKLTYDDDIKLETNTHDSEIIDFIDLDHPEIPFEIHIEGETYLSVYDHTVSSIMFVKKVNQLIFRGKNDNGFLNIHLPRPTGITIRKNVITVNL